MNFTQAITTCFQKYATFRGRATRSEFWWFALFTVLASIVASMFGELLNALVSLALFIPSLAVGARRLHDIGKTGWLQLVWIIPVIGWAIMIYWDVQPSGPPNEYGELPASPEPTAVMRAPGQQ
jgi:uncharacterized membrane protein YhaH (DUF805 family)